MQASPSTLANDFLSPHFLPPRAGPTFHMPSRGFSADVAELWVFGVALCPRLSAEQEEAAAQREPSHSCSSVPFPQRDSLHQLRGWCHQAGDTGWCHQAGDTGVVSPGWGHWGGVTRLGTLLWLP